VLVDQILESKGRDVTTVAPDASITDAVALLNEHNVGALVVSAGDGAVDGILSERDIVRALGESPDVLQRSVSDLMARDVVTCHGRANTEDLMNAMTAGRFRHVPIVEDGRLCGIVSIGDVVKARIDELATETQQLVGYIQHGR
jgi:CBS domain-containing protein